MLAVLAPLPSPARCGGDALPLSRIAAGNGSAPREGTRVTVEATVTAAFLGRDRLDGFYLAQRPKDGALPFGLFVYAPELDADQRGAVRPGAVLRVTGRVGRYRGQRQLERLSRLSACGEGRPINPIPLELPADRARLRRLEGLPVRIDQTLTVTGNHDLAHYGSLTLSSGGRLFVDESPDDVKRRTLILDDGSHRVGPRPVPYLDGQGTRRVGSRLDGLRGVLAGTFHAFRVHPTRPPEWADGNPRRLLSAPARGQLRIAVFNIENYFTDLGRRGAKSRSALARQQGKLVAAVAGLDADILGLLEVENTAAAARRLVKAVNARMAPGERYRVAVSAAPVGDDAIRPLLLYRDSAVNRVGEGRVAERGVFERPVLLARFAAPGTRPFTVALTHFKSKGGCHGAKPPDAMTGCWNERRVAQSRALLDVLESSVDGASHRYLALGDLNAYSGEAPVAVLRRGGLADLVAGDLPRAQRYTYVYRSRSGALDHILAGTPLATDVASVRIWHINADEPAFVGYGGGRSADGPYRSSDHDPVIVDLGSAKQ